MSLESEAVTLLRADTALGILLPGGIYSYSARGLIGITDDEATPAVWAGGIFQPTGVVRQRAPVPTGQLVDLRTQTTDFNQVAEVRVYALNEADIEAGHNRIYAIMQGYRFTSAWGATWVFTVPAEQAPELPAGILVERRDYMIRALKRAA